MLSVGSRCASYLSTLPRGARLKEILKIERCQTACYTTASSKIVRVNNRRQPVSVRPSSTKPPDLSQPPPPYSEGPPKKSPAYLIGGALAATGLATGVYLYLKSDQDIKVVNVAPQKKPLPKCIPANIDDIPSHIQYLLIGGGTASFAAFRAIKSNEPKAQVLLISEEEFLPYMRPPLSKEFWKNTQLSDVEELTFQQWNGNRRSLYYESSAFYADVASLAQLENGGVGVARGYRAVAVEPGRKEVTVSAVGQENKVISYDKCLIATGVRPRNIPVLEESPREVRERCSLVRTVKDATELWRRLEGARDVLVVGGGFLGSEMACALASRGAGSGPRVTQVFKESGNLAHILPSYLASWCSRQVAKLGVRVMPDSVIVKAHMKGGRVVVDLASGESLETDLIVVGAGSTPNVELGERSGLEVDQIRGGFLVNSELQARSDLYVAGDVACFYDPALGRRRVEHHDHAVVSGRLAGENMAGARKHYTHQSMFWSDLGPDVGLEAIGIIDSKLSTVAVFSEKEAAQAVAASADSVSASPESVSASPELMSTSPESVSASPESVSASPESVSALPESSSSAEPDYEKGVVFYMEGRRIVGILMWNLYNRMTLARQLLSSGAEYEDMNEVAKLFRLHE